MTKRTYASVTEEPCTCRYLRNAAEDPNNPITFDAETAEYQFVYGQAMLVIYHCPFCGGAAPESQRSLLFAQIPEAEEERLATLFEGIETVNQALNKFGQPDFEGLAKSTQPEEEDRPPMIQHHRVIHFYKLSSVADVWVTERTDGKIDWQLQGKYIGRQLGDTAP